MRLINLWMKTITKICVSEMEGTAQKALIGRYGLGKHKSWWLSPLTRRDWTPAQVWWEKAASDGGALWGRWRLVVVRLHRREQQHLLERTFTKERRFISPCSSQANKRRSTWTGEGTALLESAISWCSASITPLVWYASVKSKRPH